MVDCRHYDSGECSCYVGAHGTLCKHMVALALYMVQGGNPLDTSDTEVCHHAVCSGKLGELDSVAFETTKQDITTCLQYIKGYSGRSSTWFAYQASLAEGCNRLASCVSRLPVSEQTAGLLVNLLLRLDRKLVEGGVDDSDGTVGDCILEIVAVLQQFIELDPRCLKPVRKLQDRETCFDWEQPLVDLLTIKLTA